MGEDRIKIRGARQHNLKNLNLDIPAGRLVVVTGLSGSGKSSLAFDTIYAEGQRRYVESLSAYARQFLDQMQKPDVDHIEGLPPAIAIEQRMQNPNPRSTLATTTEVYDYLRLLFARCGRPHCPSCGREVRQQTADEIVDGILRLPIGTRIMVVAPLVRGQKGEHKEVIRRVQGEGFVRVRIDGKVFDAKATPPLKRTQLHNVEAVVDRLAIKPNLRNRLADSVETALRLAEGLLIIAHEGHRNGPSRASGSNEWTDTLYSQLYACPDCHESFDELTPRMFSFNSPYGACPECDGLGTQLEFDPELLVPDSQKSLADGGVELFRRNPHRLGLHPQSILDKFAESARADLGLPLARLPAAKRKKFLHGGNGFEGLIPLLQQKFRHSSSQYVKRRLMEYMSDLPCPSCGGARLRAEALAVTIADRSIADIAAMSIAQAVAFFDQLKLQGPRAVIADQILRQIRRQLHFMDEIGLGYLTLDRQTRTLAGGEAQRIRLATQIGSGLVGVCYVLDEPTIGLHPRDNQRLLAALGDLRDMGNSLLVVEHDEDTIRAADYVIDMGPGAGLAGGHIVCQGTLEQIIACRDSQTGQFLSGRAGFSLPSRRRRISRRRAVTVKGAAEHNLQRIDVTIPLGVFTCVTGVSGSGKSTLVGEILLPGLRRHLYGGRHKPGRHTRITGLRQIDKVVQIDQSPIGRTPRSNAATYTGLFDLVRQVFARTREAKIRGYKPGRFSFNVKGGRCESCQGQGVKKIEMHFLPDLFVVCQTCQGSRYNRETLEIRYRTRNVADLLDMSVDEASEFFENFPKISAQLATLREVGLGYIKLGQPSTTLSGGEAQRVKLAAELGKVATGRTLYVLDEPTTGLHFADIQRLLDVLGRLVDKGNTVVVIEHNLEVISHADWVIDLGPDGGDKGGRIVATGTPEQLADHPGSHTGRHLSDYLCRHASRVSRSK
ncbi:MAG: excinuclease ABC subunit UvrA [Anaerolineaceae bacterium]|nr:excinuclease ABC subunit UvrA [Anaerolineaceae bacterium]